MQEIKIDLKGMPLGRAASTVARLIIGKDSTNYAPNKLSENKVVVSNVELLSFSGRKLIQKKYYRHSGHIGSLKTTSLDEKFKTDAKAVFTDTVKGMLPKNRLGNKMIHQLRFE